MGFTRNPCYGGLSPLNAALSAAAPDGSSSCTTWPWRPLFGERARVAHASDFGVAHASDFARGTVPGRHHLRRARAFALRARRPAQAVESHRRHHEELDDFESEPSAWYCRHASTPWRAWLIAWLRCLGWKEDSLCSSIGLAARLRHMDSSRLNCSSDESIHSRASSTAEARALHQAAPVLAAAAPPVVSPRSRVHGRVLQRRGDLFGGGPGLVLDVDAAGLDVPFRFETPVSPRLLDSLHGSKPACVLRARTRSTSTGVARKPSSCSGQGMGGTGAVPLISSVSDALAGQFREH